MGRLALVANFESNLVNQMTKDNQFMDDLGLIVRDVCVFGKASLYTCHHHLTPHQLLNGCLCPYYANEGQLLMFDERRVALAEWSVVAAKIKEIGSK